MEWLEAALAFAVVMMVFSTVVAVLVESAHMVLRLREKGLRRFMEVIYKQVVCPRFSLDPAGVDEFVRAMTTSRFEPADGQATAIKRLVPRLVNAGELKNLATVHFIERLPETAAGRRLVAETVPRGRAELEAVLRELARKYEEIGASATEYFARRAKLVSVTVAVGLAFALNINAVQLFESVLTDKEMRAALIARGEAMAQNGAREPTAADAASPSSADAASAAASAANADAAANAEQLAQHAAAIRAELATLRKEAVPFGWEHAPWRSDEWRNNADPMVRGGWLVQWMLSVLLAGVLIGLGGPFWFDAFRKLSMLTGVTRGVRTARRGSTGERRDAEAAAARTGDYVQVFETAARGQGAGVRVPSPVGADDR